MGLRRFIEEAAAGEGFAAVGFARAGRVPDSKFRMWIEKGCQGEMAYLERTLEKRLDPRLVLEDVRTVVSLLYPYPHQAPPEPENRKSGRIARYALGRDYHLVIEKKLLRILRALRGEFPGVEGRFYVDSGPVAETYWAWQAGLGWIGRNSLLISREHGSWFFLSEILLNAAIEPGQPSPDYCRTCTACIDACPTGAITEPGTVDARKCISYLTIEHRAEIPEGLRKRLGNRIFGCDICQEACPWNRQVPERIDPLLEPVPRDYSLEHLAEMTPGEFKEVFRQSPVKRTGLEGLRRNVAAARKNMSED